MSSLGKSGAPRLVALGTACLACSGVERDGRTAEGPAESTRGNVENVSSGGAGASDTSRGSGASAGSGASGRAQQRTVAERLDDCARDPRVVADLVSQSICAGADIFFRETFDGNGRTCGSCHPVANNTTLDVPFIAALHETNPNDPLFVFETNPALRELETSDLLTFATILENVDGFQDPTHRFVSRSVSHVLSLATSTTPDAADGSANPPVERTGWSGDGAPGDGSLRSFLEGAIKQRFWIQRAVAATSVTPMQEPTSSIPARIATSTAAFAPAAA